MARPLERMLDGGATLNLLVAPDPRDPQLHPSMLPTRAAGQPLLPESRPLKPYIQGIRPCHREDRLLCHKSSAKFRRPRHELPTGLA